MSSCGNQLNKYDKLLDCVQQSVSEKVKQRIAQLISEVNQFSDIEKLLFYIQLPNGSPCNDLLKHKGSGNPFGKKADAEVAQTYTWIQSHLEEDPTVSLPKHEVYDEYKCFCQSNQFEPLCVADFGKAMKHIFPKVKPRRLGQRGNSRYCYSGLRKKLNLPPPSLPNTSANNNSNDDDKNVLTSSSSSSSPPSFNNDLKDDESSDNGGLSHDLVQAAAHSLILDWAEKALGRNFPTIKELGRYLIDCDLVDKGSFAAFALISSTENTGGRIVLPVDPKAKNFQLQQAQFYVQKRFNHKGLSKEPKKKIERSKSLTTSTFMFSPQNGSKSRRGRRLSPNSEYITNGDNCKPESSFSKLKTEGENIQLVEIDKASSSLVQSSSPKTKIAIPQTGSSSHIIVLPSLSPVKVSATRCLSQAISDTSGSQSVQTPVSSSPNKPVTLKYKKIQPKPVSCSIQNDAIVDASLTYSNAGSSKGLETIDCCERFIIRRSSATIPVSCTQHESPSSSSSPPLSSDHDDKNLGKSQVKRHYEASKEHLSSSKRRLLAAVDNVNCSKTSILDCNTDGNTPCSNGTNSTASLSPVLRSQTNGCENIISSNQMDIKLQELECDALSDDLNDNGNSNMGSYDECNPNTLSQLRLLLEKNLPKSKSSNSIEEKISSSQGKNFEGNLENKGIKLENREGSDMNSITSTMSGAIVSNTFNTCFIADEGNHNQHCDMANSSINDKCLINYGNMGDSTDIQTQASSVPASPNSRRQAFSFQPISQRITPTIPENNSIKYSNSFNNIQQGPSPQYNSNHRSIGADLSQPPSSANSPFVSPRDTPIPRSRHDSGQSSYSASRQTPYPVIDSGLSSISSSPFISPQSTPVPLSRIRPCTNINNYQRNMVNRARHSSGPGNPFTSMAPNGKGGYNLRSASVSPMISPNGDINLNANPLSIINTHLNSQSTNSSTSNNGTPMSPLSPTNAMNSSENLSSSSELSLAIHSQSLVDSGFGSREWLNSTGSSHSEQSFSSTNPIVRQRHFSSPYATFTNGNMVSSMDSHSREIRNLFKNGNYTDPTFTESPGRPPLNRCHSVPVQRQLIASCSVYNGSDMILTPLSSLDMSPESEHSTSKSHPPTPICANNNFHFPSSPTKTNAPTKIPLAIHEEDTASPTFIEGGHDVMVSGLQPKDWSVSETNVIRDEMEINVTTENHSSNSLLNYDPRRTVDETISSTNLCVDLGTTLDDLRDCDNDFSKFTLDFGLENDDTSNTIGDM